MSNIIKTNTFNANKTGFDSKLNIIPSGWRHSTKSTEFLNHFTYPATKDFSIHDRAFGSIKRMLTNLRNEFDYDYIVIDCAPITNNLFNFELMRESDFFIGITGTDMSSANSMIDAFKHKFSKQAHGKDSIDFIVDQQKTMMKHALNSSTTASSIEPWLLCPLTHTILLPIVANCIERHGLSKSTMSLAASDGMKVLNDKIPQAINELETTLDSAIGYNNVIDSGNGAGTSITMHPFIRHNYVIPLFPKFPYSFHVNRDKKTMIEVREDMLPNLVINNRKGGELSSSEHKFSSKINEIMTDDAKLGASLILNYTLNIAPLLESIPDSNKKDIHKSADKYVKNTRTKVIFVSSSKGGVGKTHFVKELSASLTRIEKQGDTYVALDKQNKNTKVLMIDADPQGSLTDSFVLSRDHTL
jgi:cellulose biosynthesis protein BcsQ